MLEPGKRQIYADLLAPPAGTSLVKAVGMSFSVDLFALLYVPMFFANRAAFQKMATDQDNSDTPPLSLIESLRRHSGRITLFCQRGRMSVPRSHSILYHYLDDMVQEVHMPDISFHPKLWLLHFEGERPDGRQYRVVCMSRNLTLDRSWDVSVCLDGFPEQESNGKNEPLVGFLRNLSAQQSPNLPLARRQHLRDFIDELPKVKFEPPDGFDDVGFASQGFDEGRILDSFQPCERRFVLSPFLGRLPLQSLLDKSKVMTLVSNDSSLNDLHETDAQLLKRLDARYFAGDFAISESDADIQDGGLHAKLYVEELGRKAVWHLGSANCTFAGLGGRNVEFMIRLSGDVDKVGLNALLQTSQEKNEIGLADLFVEYTPPQGPEETDPDLSQAGENCEQIRRWLASGALNLIIQEYPAEDNESDFAVRLRFVPDTPPLAAINYSGSFWMIGQDKETCACDIAQLIEAKEAHLGRVSLKALSSFVAFEITSQVGSAKENILFVLRAEPEGFPNDRLDRVLGAIVQDTDGFLRYLRLLLADEEDYWDFGALADTTGSYDSSHGVGHGEFPLFERLIKSCAEDPHRIDEIESLVKTLERTGRKKSVVPEDFLAIWKPIVKGLKGYAKKKR